MLKPFKNHEKIMNIFCPLGSGSKGNSIYIATETTKMLIDAGLSYKQTEERLSSINVDIKDLDAVVITHEHSDHVKGLDVLCSKLQIPVLANMDTARELQGLLKNEPRFKIFSTGEPFVFGDIQFHPFSIQHDTVDPVAFTLQVHSTKIGVCTDLGFATTLVAMHLKNCDYLYLESNHDPELVHASSRPYVYKQRVLSRQGHLSNQDCGKLLSAVAHAGLKHVYLAHLSSDCNVPEVALNTVKEIVASEGRLVDLSIAYQDKVSRKILF